MSAIAETKLLSAAQVAKVLGLSTTAVYAMCAAGEIEHHRVGTGERKRVRISEDELADYLERTKVSQPPDTVPLPPPRPASRMSAAGATILRSYGWRG